MGYNSKEIKVQPTEQKKTNPYRKDVIVDPAGQWKYPGQVTKIPSNQITMKGVPYPVLGVDNLGNKQMMVPGAHYTFPGQNVTEYPQLQQGGEVTAEQAQAFLDAGDIYGHPLTQAQEDYFTNIVESAGGDVESSSEDAGEDGEEMRYGGTRRRGTTHNPAVGVNDLMLRNPLYHTPKHLHFVPSKEQGGEMNNDDNFYIQHQDADRLRKSTPINFLNMPYYGFGGPSNGPLGYFGDGGRKKGTVEPVNPNYTADSMATVNYAAQHPELYDPNRMQWSTNPTGDALYKQPVVNGKPGRKIPVPFGKNMPEEQTKAIKWSINQMNENNKGDGAPQPYPGLFGVPPQNKFGGDNSNEKLYYMQEGGTQLPALPPVPDPSLAPLNPQSIYDIPLNQVGQQKGILHPNTSAVNYDMSLNEVVQQKGIIREEGGNSSPMNYGAFPVMAGGGEYNMIINDLLKKQFGGPDGSEKTATSIDGVIDSKKNFFNNYIRNNVGKALVEEMHQEMMNQPQIPSMTKQIGGETGDDLGVDAFYAQQFPTVYPQNNQPAQSQFPNSGYSTPQGSFTQQGVQTADPYGMMPQVDPYFASQAPSYGQKTLEVPASTFKTDATTQNPNSPQAPAVQNWSMDPNQSRTNQPQPQNQQKRGNAYSISMNGVDKANAVLGIENRLSNMIESHQNYKQEQANNWRQSGDATFMARPETSSSRGDYDPNSGKFRVNQMVPVQFRGNNMGNAGTNEYYAQYGGAGFNQNDEVYMSDEDIQNYLAAGGSVEYLD